MEFHMPDRNTFLLTPLIQSALKLRTSKKCPENEEPNETDQFVKNTESTEIRLKRYFCSGSKVPEDLINEALEKCRDKEGFAEKLSKNVFNNELVVSHQIRCQFQVNVIKNFISQLEKNNVSVPDSMYDRLGTLMGMKEPEFVERLYLDEIGDKVIATFSESVNQLSMGTTGLSVWQASCDLANLFRLIPSNSFNRIVELGSGCGVSGISIAKTHGCQVVLSDVDENVLELLEKNLKKNNLDRDENEDEQDHQGKGEVRVLDWCDFDFSEWKEPSDFIIAADVVYDTALLASLCNVLRLLLRHSRAAIVACTRRNESSIQCFEHHLKMAKLDVIEKIEYENGHYFIEERNSHYDGHFSIFPFFSSLKTPTIFYNIQPKK